MLHRSISYRTIVGHGVVVIAVLLLAVGSSTNVGGQTSPGLGAATSYAVLGGSTVTNTGATTVGGDLGVSPGSAVSGFPPGIVTGGTIHAADAHALAAQNSVITAYNTLTDEPCTDDLTGQDLGGLTLTPGVYCFSTSAQLTGQLTLNVQGATDAVFIFKMGSTLTTASNSSIVAINGEVGCNVFWQVGTSATLGTGTVFAGNIIALSSITLTTGVSVSGRALARTGAVTMDTNNVGFSACAAPAATYTATPTVAPTATPTERQPRRATSTATTVPTATSGAPTSQPPTVSPPPPTATPYGGPPVVQPPVTGTGAGASSGTVMAWILLASGGAASALGAVALRARKRVKS